MIRYRAIGFVLGQFLLALGAAMLLPAAWGAARGGDGVRSLLQAAALTLLSGLALSTLCGRPRHELVRREGLLLVVAAWLAVSFFGCLPFLLSPHFGSLTNAFFEAASGFTTTGATVLDRVEVLPEPIQLWRCLSHWLGGMGIVLLGVAVLPLVGHGGMQLYRAEFSGAKSEQLKPRIAETARSLWRIYLALTAALFAALLLAGMTPFEALCHSFSTLGTGGFSTRTASVAGFASPLIEWILIVFMLLAGISFVLHYRIFVEGRPREALRDVELRGYLALVAAGSLVVSASLLAERGYPAERALRTALFQVSSIVTTTGFVSDDFERWAPLPQVLLLAFMFVGGCTGSTAGGLKTARLLLLAKVVDREFKRMVERRGVFAVRLGGRVVDEATVQSLLNLVYLAFVVNFAAVLALAALGVDVLTSISAVAASMFNVGPGLGRVGPAEHYGHLPWLAKWVLSGCMIAGRLEYYTVIVILTPAFWRR